MNYELEKKLNRIVTRYPLSPALSGKLKFLDLFDFTCTHHRLEQNPLTESFILEILSDSYVQEASLDDYEIIKKIKKIYSEFFILKSMETDLDKKTLKRLYALLTNKNEDEIIFENEKKLDEFFTRKTMRDFSNDLIEEAVFVHNGIFSVRPVSQHLTTIAYIAMQFILIRYGFFTIPFSHDEYLKALETSNQGKDLRSMYELTVQNAIAKTDKIVRIVDTESLM